MGLVGYAIGVLRVQSLRSRGSRYTPFAVLSSNYRDGLVGMVQSVGMSDTTTTTRPCVCGAPVDEHELRADRHGDLHPTGCPRTGCQVFLEADGSSRDRSDEIRLAIMRVNADASQQALDAALRMVGERDAVIAEQAAVIARYENAALALLHIGNQRLAGATDSDIIAGRDVTSDRPTK